VECVLELTFIHSFYIASIPHIENKKAIVPGISFIDIRVITFPNHVRIKYSKVRDIRIDHDSLMAIRDAPVCAIQANQLVTVTQFSNSLPATSKEKDN
jgi:hypothetical protein